MTIWYFYLLNICLCKKGKDIIFGLDSIIHRFPILPRTSSFINCLIVEGYNISKIVFVLSYGNTLKISDVEDNGEYTEIETKDSNNQKSITHKVNNPEIIGAAKN